MLTTAEVSCDAEARSVIIGGMVMATDCWMHSGPDILGPAIHALTAALLRCSISAKPAPVVHPVGLGLCVAGEITDELRDFLRSASASRDSVAHTK